MRFKTCEHKYILKANNDTVISFSDQDDSIFPKNMFQFKDFGSLKAPGGVDCNQLIDLIGRVVSIHQPKDIQVKQNSQRLIDFVIEDCRESRLTVTLWDEHVDSVLPFFNVALTDPLIVILQLCRDRVTDDIQRDWYFIACKNKGCGKKLQEINDQMYCKSCGQESPHEIIKYKLVIDILDDEQDGQLILWDNVCSPLLGITASELKGKYSEEGCMPNEIEGLIGKTMKFRIVTREDQFKYRGNDAFTVLRVQADEAISNSFKKGEQGSVIRKLAAEKEFNENFGQGIEPLEVITSSNPEVIILDESTPEQQSLKRINMDCSSSSKTLKKPKNEPNPF
ncbi:uncharacterized protein LOC116029777 [Ipomoea triloba]|uniref:uncharacterized protein LOC116029777 n=1 Tax=Ipomoea triloba TaxID=35885 RepID=UPI00125D11B8|nr:uncharacterized protein LOC116029777 [Ipomoea triloba]